MREEKVMRGNDPYINYKCDGCRYSWQVKEAPKRPAPTKKRPAASSDEAHKGD